MSETRPAAKAGDVHLVRAKHGGFLWRRFYPSRSVLRIPACTRGSRPYTCRYLSLDARALSLYLPLSRRDSAPAGVSPRWRCENERVASVRSLANPTPGHSSYAGTGAVNRIKENLLVCWFGSECLAPDQRGRVYFYFLFPITCFFISLFIYWLLSWGSLLLSTLPTAPSAQLIRFIRIINTHSLILEIGRAHV